MPARPPRDTSDPILCPGCSTKLKELVSAVQALPEENDLFLCGKCATLSRFTRAGLFALTEAEKAELSDEDKDELIFATRNILARAEHNKHTS